ncbi:MAG TPA: amino acid ABC transporter permease [Acidimicrobiia bacterium]|nr:amino acid ABC transporter permease [Acidimicrobiia bacterium]
MEPTPLERLERRGPGLPWPRRSARYREEGTRAALVAVVSTVVVFGVLIALVLNSAAWPRVQRQFFSWTHFKASFPQVLDGFWLDIKLFLLAEVLILAIGLVVAMARSLRGPAFLPLRILTIGYIDLARGLPLLLLILLMGFGIPALQLPGVPNGPLFWGVAALVFSYAAYTAEVYRAGIDSVHESQRMSARSIGLTQGQALWHVIVPQAVRNVVPALLNGFVSLQKDVALVFVLGIREGLREADIYNARSFNYTSYIAAAILFLLVSVPVARFTDWYTDRQRRRMQAMST